MSRTGTGPAPVAERWRSRTGWVLAVLAAMTLAGFVAPGSASAAPKDVLQPADPLVGVWIENDADGGVADEFRTDGTAVVLDGRFTGPCQYTPGEVVWRGLTRTGSNTYAGESLTGVVLETSQGVICGGKGWRPGVLTITGDTGSLVVETALSGPQAREIKRAPYQNCPESTAPADGAGSIFESVLVDSLGDSPYETHSFCSVPLRRGDDVFGRRHLEVRNAAVGRHEWDLQVKTEVAEALGQPGASLESGGGYYVYASAVARAGVNGYQCVFVDSKAFGVDDFKGIITTYWVEGAYSGNPSQCDQRAN